MPPRVYHRGFVRRAPRVTPSPAVGEASDTVDTVIRAQPRLRGRVRVGGRR